MSADVASRLAPAQPDTRGRGRSAPGSTAGLVSVVTVLGAWELVIRSGLVSAESIPPMSDVAAEMWRLLGTSELWSAVGSTLRAWALGLGIAVGLGLPLGILIGSSYYLHRATRGLIEFLRPVPSVALIPAAVLIFGIGLKSEVFLAAFAAFWPVLVQTIYGVRDVDSVALDTGRVFGLSAKERLCRITLPSCAPFAATGLRISSAVALMLAVTAELLLGSAGLGREISLARTAGDLDAMYALIVVIGLLGLGLNVATTTIERRTLHWHVSHRTVG